jgi:hypothetical protein
VLPPCCAASATSPPHVVAAAARSCLRFLTCAQPSPQHINSNNNMAHMKAADAAYPVIYRVTFPWEFKVRNVNNITHQRSSATLAKIFLTLSFSYKILPCIIVFLIFFLANGELSSVLNSETMTM